MIAQGEIDAGNIPLLQLDFGKITAGIGNNLIAHFIHSVILD